MATTRPRSLKGRALQALALRDHSRAELREKLLRSASASASASAASADAGPDSRVDASAVDAVLDELQARGFLNDARFVESRVHSRASKFGQRRIQAELAQHGLRLDEHTAAELRRTEAERARAVWARKFGETPAVDLAQRARQMRFLAARGFSPEAIRQVIRGGDPDD